VRGRLLALAAATAAMGCNPKATSPHPGISNSCTVTFSGAFSGGPYDCRPATTAWSLADGNGGFSFAVTKGGTTPGVSVAIVWIGQPSTITYANSDLGAEADISVTTASNQTWSASVGGAGAAAGSYSLTFTSVVDNLTTPTGKGYSSEGTLTATLAAVAASGATGTVTLTATF
jgi:hypothetical protein